jgi:hypothetical protein
MALNETPRGKEFKAYRERLLKALNNPSSVPSEVAKDLSEMNEALKFMAARKSGKVSPEAVMKALTVGDVQTTPVLQEFAVKYANDEYVGLEVMPRVPVAAGTGAAEYWVESAETALTAPDDTIGTDGSVNQVSAGLTKDSATMNPHALEDRVDARTQAAMDNVVRLLLDPLASVMDALLARQESRIATAACTSSNYGSNTSAIAAGDRWNAAGGGDPTGAVATAKDTLLLGSSLNRTVGFCGVAAWNVLRRHPAALDMYKYRATGDPLLSRQQVAAWLDLDDLYVGRARLNTSLRGATASYSRCWTDTVFGVVRVSQMPAIKQACFGITLQEPFAETEFFNPDSGGWGEFISKVAHADSHKVVSASCGYLYTTVINT